MVLALAANVFAGTPPLPRKSPEFVITDVSGKPISLSAYRGKVVVMTFMYTTCPHCQREAQMVTKLQRDYSAKGLQVLGAAFNFEDKDTAAMKASTVAKFNQEFNVGYPVGYASRDAVVGFLGISVMDRYVVPQVAVIDRKGNIVKQSDSTMGSEELQTEASLRAVIEKLLAEGAGTTSSAKPAPAAVAKSATKSN